MKYKFVFALISYLILSFTACAPTEELGKPIVMIYQPTASMYNNGDTINVEVHFEDAEELHEYHIAIQNTTDSTEVFHLHGHSHSKHKHIDTAVVLNTGTSRTDFVIEAMASNHNNQSTMSTHDFHIMP